MNGAPLHSCLVQQVSNKPQVMKYNMYYFNQLLPLLCGDNRLLFSKIRSTYTGRKPLTEPPKYFTSLFPATVCEGKWIVTKKNLWTQMSSRLMHIKYRKKKGIWNGHQYNSSEWKCERGKWKKVQSSYSVARKINFLKLVKIVFLLLHRHCCEPASETWGQM